MIKNKFKRYSNKLQIHMKRKSNFLLLTIQWCEHASEFIEGKALLEIPILGGWLIGLLVQICIKSVTRFKYLTQLLFVLTFLSLT